MRKSLLATIAGAALIAGGGLAAAQGSPEHELGGALQGPAQGRSGAVEEKERRSGQADAVQGPPEGRSGRSVGSATLSPDQKTRLHEVITGENVQRVNHADFALSVGTRVPNTVTFYDVPDTIVDILPQYRGFEYIIVRDDLVIIDPETLEIVLDSIALNQRRVSALSAPETMMFPGAARGSHCRRPRSGIRCKAGSTGQDGYCGSSAAMT